MINPEHNQPEDMADAALFELKIKTDELGREAKQLVYNVTGSLRLLPLENVTVQVGGEEGIYNPATRIFTVPNENEEGTRRMATPTEWIICAPNLITKLKSFRRQSTNRVRNGDNGRV